MSEIVLGGNTVADELLEFFHFRKATFGFSVPDEIAINRYGKAAPGVRRFERDGTELCFKSCEQFLSRPPCPQEPAAARTVFDFNLWFHGNRKKGYS